MQVIILLVHIDGLDFKEAWLAFHFISKYIEVSPFWQVYDAVEVFAGIGMLSRCLQCAGFETATLEIQDWSPFVERRKSKRLRRPLCKGNPLDLLSPSGFAFLN